MTKYSWLLAMTMVPYGMAASWTTFGGDSQRSGWAKEETSISPETVSGMRLLWKLKLDNQPKELNDLTPAVVVNPVYTSHGAETYVVVGGSSDNLYVIDADTGKLVWKKHFENSAPPPSGPQSHGSYFCPNALNDTPVIVRDSKGPSVDVISIDGKLHSLNLVNGEDRFPPKQFVPAYSKNWSLNAVGGTIYTTTSQGCGQAKSGVWAMEVTKPDQPVHFFESDAFGGGVWGRGGASVSSEGVYAETGDGPFDPVKGKYADTVLKLAPVQLSLLDYFTPTNANYLTRKDLDMGNSTPVVFKYKDRELLVASGKEGRLFLLDTKSPGGASHREPLFETSLFANEEADIAGRGFWGAFASFEDTKGARWVYAPAWGKIVPNSPKFPLTHGDAPDGSIMAFRVEERDGKPVLAPAWVSHNMSVPEPPVIANGVVFALSSGEFVRQVKPDGSLYTAEERAQRSTGKATLYAFDAQTGKELFSSGGAMSSFTHLGGLAVSDGRVYITTHDSTVYAFGFQGQ
jgi:outer membrane protein assembly factor BamB